MSYWSDEEEAEPREIELPTVIVTPPGPCVTCGSWILDSWHEDAPEENEFWCHKHVGE